jgi:hypothetical protein
VWHSVYSCLHRRQQGLRAGLSQQHHIRGEHLQGQCEEAVRRQESLSLIWVFWGGAGVGASGLGSASSMISGGNTC